MNNKTWKTVETGRLIAKRSDIAWLIRSPDRPDWNRKSKSISAEKIEKGTENEFTSYFQEFLMICIMDSTMWQRLIIDTNTLLNSNKSKFQSFDNSRWLLKVFQLVGWFTWLCARLRFRSWVSRRLFEEVWMRNSHWISKILQSLRFDDWWIVKWDSSWLFVDDFFFLFSPRKLINKVKVYLKNAFHSFPVAFWSFSSAISKH